MNVKTSVLIFGILPMMACAPKGILPATEVYPVQWFPGFDIIERLAKNIPVYNQQDVQTLLEKPWEDPFQLIN